MNYIYSHAITANKLQMAVNKYSLHSQVVNVLKQANVDITGTECYISNIAYVAILLQYLKVSKYYIQIKYLHFLYIR